MRVWTTRARRGSRGSNDSPRSAYLDATHAIAPTNIGSWRRREMLSRSNNSTATTGWHGLIYLA